MMDCAFFRLPDGQAWLGVGPFAEAAEPASDPCFYVNDFTLSSATPWRKPQRLIPIGGAEELAAHLGNMERPSIVWQKPATEWFKMAFRRIRRDVVGHRVRKMVPVLTERGVLQSGCLAALLHRVMQAPLGLWGYASIAGDRGFMGATPELLLSTQGRALTTMALAGTAKPNGADSFATDAKEIDEHELVASFLDEVLHALGQVTRSAREVSEAAGLTHFRTHLSVLLDSEHSLNDLVQRLHPTPAVGCLPRNEASLARLLGYRKQLGAPEFFGAPFGLKIGDAFHCVVSIRGGYWNGTDVQLPSGCGIVGGSAFDHEWRELRLKRDSVAKLLGL
ncbi:MAG: chorismate-binding protein [Roseimicrobium sp.]